MVFVFLLLPEYVVSDYEIGHYKMGLVGHYFWNQMFCSEIVKLCYEVSETSSLVLS